MKFLGHESLNTTIKYIHSFSKGSGRIGNKTKNEFNINYSDGNVDDLIKNCPTEDLPKLVVRLHLQGKITESQLDKYMIVLGVKGRN